MTARRILRWVLLAALLCVLLASAALAAETPTVDSIQDAQANLEKTVEKQEDSFVVSLPSMDDLSLYTNALQNYILGHEDCVDVSPRITAVNGSAASSAMPRAMSRLRSPTSRSIARTRKPSRARQAAIPAQRDVFPVPPFPEINDTI